MTTGHVEYLRDGHPGSCDFLLFDIEDMFYSILHYDLLRAVEERIDMFGFLAFSRSSGIASDSFLELLRFYLMSTFVAFEGDNFFAEERYMYWVDRCASPQ